jgi:hypothetical protein
VEGVEHGANGAIATSASAPSSVSRSPQPLVVADLGRGHPGQRGPSGQRRGQPGVLGEPVERGELPVREHAEQVDDGLRSATGVGVSAVLSAASWTVHWQSRRRSCTPVPYTQ